MSPQFLIDALPPIALILLTGGAAYFSVYAGLSVVLEGGGAPSQTGKRIKELRAARQPGGKARKDSGSAADRRKQVEQRLKEQDARRKRSNSLAALLDRADMKTTVTRYMLTFAVLAIALSMGVMFMGWSPILIPVILGVCLMVLPRKLVKRRLEKRKLKFIEELPNAIDVLVRGVRTGLPVADGLKLIGREIPQPVGGEFERLTDSLMVGLPLEDALRRFYDRMPIAEMNFFAIVLIIQKQTGGNLAEALGNLSAVIRERKKLKGKIRALSSEAKASAMIIGSLPFVLGLVLLAVSPEYIALLFTDRLGNYLIAGGLFWMGLGWTVMSKMIDIDI